jgi:release factor glutamine methyltransferase
MSRFLDRATAAQPGPIGVAVQRPSSPPHRALLIRLPSRAGRGSALGPTRPHDVARRSLRARAVLKCGLRRLRASRIPSARAEAEWLLGHLLGVRPLDLYLDESPCPADVADRFVSLIDARIAGTPLAYLIGEAEFFGRPFVVRPGVFIPRPETEAVVAQAIEALRARRSAGPARPLRLLDLGTGTGCIAVTLALELPSCAIVGVEVSWTALQVAQENVARHGVSSRVWLVGGEWTEALRGPFDGMVANPPYVPCAQVERLPREVRQEPLLSLDGGQDGVVHLRHLIAQAPRLLAPGGLLTVECGDTQAALLAQQAAALPWAARVEIVSDLAGRPRGLVITRQANDEA